MENLKSFGKALYDLRISKDISLEKISQITNIDQICFEEFEKGNFSIKSEVYVRLFLREYIKCIDSTKLDTIMEKFNLSYTGKSKQTLTFVPDENEDLKELEQLNINSGTVKFLPKNIAIIIITFLSIVFVFRIVSYLSNH